MPTIDEIRFFMPTREFEVAPGQHQSLIDGLADEVEHQFHYCAGFQETSGAVATTKFVAARYCSMYHPGIKWRGRDTLRLTRSSVDSGLIQTMVGGKQ